MSVFVKVLAYFQSDRRAITALEYAMIAGVVGAVVAVGFGTLATDLSGKFNSLGTSL
jgi:pilus assembly protein Flp/PilA